MVGPSDLCAPEQFVHKNTPKSSEAHIGDLLSQSAHKALCGDFNSSFNMIYCCGNESILK